MADAGDDMAMGELEFTTPRAAWGGEASAFTPALASRLAYLGEVCGLGPLELTGTEIRTGARRIDVLATAEQRNVVIENQYGIADHDHLTRGLAYAVATEAAALVVIAERHTDEFVAVAEYLNRLAGYAADDEPAVSVWLVEVEAIRRVGDTMWSPLFTVRARPNQWTREVRAATSRHTVRDVATVVDQTLDPEVARWVLELWLHEDHTAAAVGGGKNPTVQLRHPDPADPVKGHSFLTIQLRRIWLNVVYTLDSSGAFASSGDRDAFETAVRRAFPDATSRRAELPAYLALEFAEVNERRDAFEEFVSWLLGHVDQRVAEIG